MMMLVTARVRIVNGNTDFLGRVGSGGKGRNLRGEGETKVSGRPFGT